MGLGFGARVLGWDSRGAEVEMPGRVGETMEEGRRGSRAWFGEVFCCLSVANMLVSME